MGGKVAVVRCINENWRGGKDVPIERILGVLVFLDAQGKEIMRREFWETGLSIESGKSEDFPLPYCPDECEEVLMVEKKITFADGTTLKGKHAKSYCNLLMPWIDREEYDKAEAKKSKATALIGIAILVILMSFIPAPWGSL